jgi:hypothetical protein
MVLLFDASFIHDYRIIRHMGIASNEEIDNPDIIEFVAESM